MSIRLRKRALAAAIEDVAAPDEQQSGSYEGPRVLSDEPARAVLDLSSYQTPVRAGYRVREVNVAAGSTRRFDLITAEDQAGQFQDADDRFGFLRFGRLRVGNTGSTGRTEVKIRLVDLTSSVINDLNIYFDNPTAGTPFIRQINYDLTTKSAPNDAVFLPADLVIPPDHRLVLLVDNNTDALDSVTLELWSYIFDELDILI